MIRKLDLDAYDASQSVTITLPFSMPYGTDSPEFERVDGVIEYQGEFYRMVKQRYARDTVYIVCVRDHQKKRIRQAMSQYVKALAGSDQSADQSQTAKLASAIIKNYLSVPFAVPDVPWELQMDKKGPSAGPHYTSSYYPSLLHPPELS